MTKKILTYFLAWLIVTWVISLPFVHAETPSILVSRDALKSSERIVKKEEQREKLRTALLKLTENLTSLLQDARERIEKNSYLSTEKQSEILLTFDQHINEVKEFETKIQGATDVKELRAVGKEIREKSGECRSLIREKAYLGLEARIEKILGKLKNSTEKMKIVSETLEKAGGQTESLKEQVEDLEVKITEIEVRFRESKNIFASGDLSKAFTLSKDLSQLLQESLIDLKTFFSDIRSEIELLKQSRTSGNPSATKS